MHQTIKSLFSDTKVQWLTILVFSAFILMIELGNKEFYAINAYYASISKSILEKNEWLTLYAGNNIYINKPPLVFWLSALSMKVFGITGFGAIFPITLSAFFCLVLINKLACSFYARPVGYISSLVCLTTFLFIQNSNNFRMEPVLLFGILLSVTSMVLPYSPRKPFLFFTGILIAVLAKGPIGFLPLALAPIYSFLKSDGLSIKSNQIIIWIAASSLLMPIAFWYFHLQLVNDVQVVDAITNDALAYGEHKLNWWGRTYHHYLKPLALFYWPWLPFLVIGIIKTLRNCIRSGIRNKQNSANLLLLIWLILIFFGASLKPTGYTRYIFLAIPPMSILVAKEVEFFFKFSKLPYWIPASLTSIVFVVSFLITCTPFTVHTPSQSEINTIKNIITANYSNNEDVLFLTERKYFQGDNPLWVQAWSHFYLNKNISPYYAEEITPLKITRPKIVLMRKTKESIKIKDVRLSSLVKSRHYELVIISPI